MLFPLTRLRLTKVVDDVGGVEVVVTLFRLLLLSLSLLRVARRCASLLLVVAVVVMADVFGRVVLIIIVEMFLMDGDDADGEMFNDARGEFGMNDEGVDDVEDEDVEEFRALLLLLFSSSLSLLLVV